MFFAFLLLWVDWDSETFPGHLLPTPTFQSPSNKNASLTPTNSGCRAAIGRLSQGPERQDWTLRIFRNIFSPVLAFANICFKSMLVKRLLLFFPAVWDMHTHTHTKMRKHFSYSFLLKHQVILYFKCHSISLMSTFLQFQSYLLFEQVFCCCFFFFITHVRLRMLEDINIWLRRMINLYSLLNSWRQFGWIDWKQRGQSDIKRKIFSHTFFQCLWLFHPLLGFELQHVNKAMKILLIIAGTFHRYSEISLLIHCGQRETHNVSTSNSTSCSSLLSLMLTQFFFF